MHMYAKFDQNIPRGSRVVSIFTNSDYSADPRVVHFFASSEMTLLIEFSCLRGMYLFDHLYTDYL